MLPRVIALFLILLIASKLPAQQTVVSRDAELNASLFFGNTSQRLAAARAGISRANGNIELGLSGRYTYADAESADGDRSVSRRSWDVATAIDWRPFATVSPFILATVESSLEKQIEFRYGVGAGAKLNIARDSVHQHNISLALLAEQTTPRVETPDFDDDVLARWSARHRIKGKLSENVTYSSTTFYKPRFDDLSDYSISSVTSLGMSLNTAMSLTFTFIDTYDSEATVRGSASNNDGQLLFGVKTVW
jgi:hypothetical protein